MNKLIMACLALLLCVSCNVKPKEPVSYIESLKKRRLTIKTALAKEAPVIALVNESEGDRYKAQSIFLNHKNIRKLYLDPIMGDKILNEIFSVSAVRPSDIPRLRSKCKTGECYRVEMYNYALNLGVIGFANVKTKQLLGLNFYPGIQPDVPPHLVDLAIAIAKNDPKVKDAYGKKMKNAEPLMPATKTALNKSKCERSQHLCVAPTFIKNSKALWAIVDLTDLKVVGVKWTNTGKNVIPLTEKRYQNENMMSCFCDKESTVEKNGWSFNYSLTRSDGLRVSQVKYNNIPVFNDVKLVDWHVSYSKTEGFGYSDAIGCPEYSQAAVLAVDPPFITPMVENGDTIGFVLTQKYFSEGWPKPCNYNYQQNYEFYNDGRFRPLAASLGRGCGMDGTYRPVTRISLAGNQNSVYEYKGDNKKVMTTEGWRLQNNQTSFSKDNYWFDVENKDQMGFHIEANKGQYNKREQGDNAYAYFTKRHSSKGEGEEDIPTIGPCCNNNYKQGPEKFMEPHPENIENSELVFWYVPQIANDGRKGQEYCWAESIIKDGVYVAKEYPCFSGPMFIPIHKK